MRKVALVCVLALAAFVAGCYVQGQARVRGPGYYQEPPPPPPPPPGEPPPPPPYGTMDRTPPPPPPPQPDPGYSTRTRVRAPDAPDTPAPPAAAMTVTLSASSAPRGSEINIYVNPARAPLVVYFNGRVLPKKTDASGTVLTVTVPGNATSGYFEVEWSGQRFQSPYLTVQ